MRCSRRTGVSKSRYSSKISRAELDESSASRLMASSMQAGSNVHRSCRRYAIASFDVVPWNPLQTNVIRSGSLAKLANKEAVTTTETAQTFGLIIPFDTSVSGFVPARAADHDNSIRKSIERRRALGVTDHATWARLRSALHLTVCLPVIQGQGDSLFIE
jgi:hypothetical protein